MGSMETNITLALLDLSENDVHPHIMGLLQRTMEEKRPVVPLPLDSKFCFLLCNRHLPPHLQLPELMQTHVAQLGQLISDDTQTPLFQIFRYAATARELLI